MKDIIFAIALGLAGAALSLGALWVLHKRLDQAS